MRALAVLALAIVLAGCGGSARKSASACTSVAQPASTERTERAPKATLDAAKTYEVVMQTNCGSFTIRLDPKRSPHAVASFVALARAGYYDRTTFYRVVPGVLIQAGDPTGSGVGGPGYTTVDRPAHAAYEHGVVAMARVQREPPGTARSQFFIVTAKTASLRPGSPIVGEVVKGLDVVDLIGTFGGETGLPSQVQHVSDRPTRIVEIERATVVTS